MKENNVPFEYEINLSHYNICYIGKHVKLFFNKSESFLTFSFQLIHSDVWQAPINSVSGFNYYVLFVDDYSRYSCVYLLKLKHEMFDKFFEFKALVENVF